MMGLGKAYLDEVRTLVDNVENTQAEKIREAAKAIADSVAHLQHP